MPSINVINQAGLVVGSLELNNEVFAIDPHQQAVRDAVVLALANARQDTAKTLKRDEVSGGGKKPWRQKGTGRARQGSTRSPQWRHGGIVFGPTGEQNHSIKQNKKERVLALKSVLSSKVSENALVVLDKFAVEGFKTKAVVESLAAMKISGKTLIVFTDDSVNDQAIQSALNLSNVELLFADQINVYDVLNASTLVMTQDAVKSVEEVLLNGKQ